MNTQTQNTRPASYVITFPSGKVGETFDTETVETARRMGMKVESIHEYLGRINAAIRATNSPAPVTITQEDRAIYWRLSPAAQLATRHGDQRDAEIMASETKRNRRLGADTRNLAVRIKASNGGVFL